ncbi:MAG: SPFH domain-containing protein [Planctomycetota bacterium]|jgi:regulator of protease activity HflC (stomatin/prohibitin superfamily)
MRVDHHAYRKATRVAAFGLFVRAAVGLTLLLFGVVGGDTVFQFASYYVFGGLLVWLSLIVIFYQHTQERLEALEADELAAARGGAGSVFEGRREEEKVAARRLRLMHHWLVPAVSLLVMVYLGLGAFWMLRFLGALDDPGTEGADFLLTAHLGWAVATCLAFAALCFIFSRFVAGMARQEAWQNLRGGAGYMVGNALIMLAAAVGIIIRYFQPDNQDVMQAVAYVVPVFMLFLVFETGIHFILNVYRPRIPGAVPRAAFDSRVLSLLAAPESIVRSLNEAVNYQFGFDITSSWGYQLLVRSFAWLLAFGAVVLVALNMIVVVEPHQQAVKLSGGAIVGGVHGSGVMWKAPWPLATAAIHDIDRIRTVHLTARRVEDPDVQAWSKDLKTDTTLDPFIVGGGREEFAADIAATAGAAGEPAEAELFSLVDAEISLDYRIKSDGLLDYLAFASRERRRGQRLDMQQSALKALALRVVTRYLSGLALSEVIAEGRGALVADLRDRIQAAWDDMNTGVELVSVNIPLLRPSGGVGQYYEDYAMAMQQRREEVVKARQEEAVSLAYWIGDPDRIGEFLEAIDEFNRLHAELGSDDKTVIDQRIRVERMLSESGGALAQEIAAAEAERWISLMEARAEALRQQGKVEAYRAAPKLFMKREFMQVLRETLPDRRKYVFVGVDPDRVSVRVELQEPASLFGSGDLISSEGETGQ